MPAWMLLMAVVFLYIYVCVVVYPVQEEDKSGVEVDGVVDISLGWGIVSLPRRWVCCYGTVPNLTAEFYLMGVLCARLPSSRP